MSRHVLQGPVTQVRTISIGEKRQPALCAQTVVNKNQALITPAPKSATGSRWGSECDCAQTHTDTRTHRFIKSSAVLVFDSVTAWKLKWQSLSCLVSVDCKNMQVLNGMQICTLAGKFDTAMLITVKQICPIFLCVGFAPDSTCPPSLALRLHPPTKKLNITRRFLCAKTETWAQPPNAATCPLPLELRQT